MVLGQVENGAYPPDQLFCAACDLQAAGYNEDDALRRLTPTALKAGLSLREIERNVHNAYSRERTSARTLNPLASRVLAWQAVQAFVTNHKWSGKAGVTDRRLMLAMIERAQLGANDSGNFRATNRELSELVRKDVSVVKRSLKRLILGAKGSQPLIVRAGRDKRSKGSLYRFSDYILKEGQRYQRQSNELTPLHLDPWDGFNGGDSPLHDLLEFKAMRWEGVLVYRQLVSSLTAMSAPALAEKTNLSASTVRTSLKRLRLFGLVEHLGRGKGYIAVPRSADELEEIARVTGTEGNGQRRREKHEDDRARNAARIIIRHRKSEDSHNLPRKLQPWHLWKCPECLHVEHNQYSALPRSCPQCGWVTVEWTLQNRRKQGSILANG
jgi:predicted transcriptional regulator